MSSKGQQGITSGLFSQNMLMKISLEISQAVSGYKLLIMSKLYFINYDRILQTTLLQARVLRAALHPAAQLSPNSQHIQGMYSGTRVYSQVGMRMHLQSHT